MQATLTLSLTIVNGVGIVTSTLPGGYVGVAYSLQCQATGGFPPYTWSASGLPAGLSISTGGLISGTPSATFNGPITLTVADSNGMSISVTLNLTVVPVPVITTPSLPGGYVNQAYSFQLQASGGYPPYTWSVAGLPSGLSVSSGGLISGTPTTTFSGNENITAADING